MLSVCLVFSKASSAFTNFSPPNSRLYTESDQFSGGIYGLDFQMYLQNQIGVSLNYEKLIEPNNSGFYGDSIVYEGFVEYGAFRLFGQYVVENVRASSDAVTDNEIKRTYQLYGLKLFF